MLQALRILLVVSSVPLVGDPATQKSLRGEPSIRFEVLADTGAHGSTTLRFHPRQYEYFSERHARGEPFVLEGLPLPGEIQADLELRPVSAVAPGARARIVGADGKVTLLAPSVRCFAGHLTGGGPAFLAVDQNALQGYFYRENELFFLSTGRNAAGRATLASAAGIGTLDGGGCGFVDEVPLPSGGIEGATVARALRTADVFIEADHEYRARFASDQECIDYTTLLLTAAGEIYRRDLGVRLRIPDGYLRVWNTIPPWGRITGYAQLKNVYGWWQSSQNPLKYLPRAAVHVLTSPVFGGTSRGVDGLCSSVRAYEISSLNGRFPYPRLHTDRYNWDLFVLCHEFGHTFGSPHSALYSPPISCTDGSGPDSGTLMSYCHLDYGIVNVGMRFHPREQQRIRAVMDTGCLETKILEPGDYDGDGILGQNDFSALDEVLAQGFRSLAAEEVFDLDGNGSINGSDRRVLAELVFAAPPAQIALRNGSGVNPGCLQPLSNPILGTTWRAHIFAPGVGSATLLVGYDQPLDGLRTLRGELLVKTATLGGQKLFTSSALSDGVSALHELVLPNDPALYGRQVTFQALIVDGPSGEQYCNAVDVILSPWE